MRLVHCSCLTPIQDNVPARRPFWTQRPACGVPSPLKVTIPSVDRGNVYTWLTYSAIRGMGGRHSVLPEAINRPVPLRSTHAWDGRRAGSNVREYQFIRSRPRSPLPWDRCRHARNDSVRASLDDNASRRTRRQAVAQEPARRGLRGGARRGAIMSPARAEVVKTGNTLRVVCQRVGQDPEVLVARDGSHAWAH